MVTQRFLLWLLMNLGYGHSIHHRLSKRSVGNSRECLRTNHKLQEGNSFLWVMERNPPVYFFGTIHVPYTKVWDYIPSNSKQAFYKSENIFFELDLMDPATLTTLAQCQILPNGIMLRDVIPRTLYRRLKRHLSYVRKKLSVWMTRRQRIAGINTAVLYKALTRNWQQKRPIWIMLMLNGLTEYDIKGHGVSILDTYLLREAVLRNKQTGSIESVKEQCKPLNTLNNSQVIIALNHTLVLHEKVRRGEANLTYSTRELIYHYNCGNLTDMLFTQDMTSLANLKNSSSTESFAMEQRRKIDKYLKEELFYKRNERMSKRILQHIQKHPKESFFFAFGAGHFLGNGSIIDRLQKQGYNISHVHPNTSLRRGDNKRVRKTGNRRNRKRRKNKGKIKRKKRRYHQRKKKRLHRSVENLWIDDHSYGNMTETPFHRPTTKKDYWPTFSSSSQSINICYFLWMNVSILQLIFAIFGECFGE